MTPDTVGDIVVQSYVHTQLRINTVRMVDERLERTHIAQELHDTLSQNLLLCLSESSLRTREPCWLPIAGILWELIEDCVCNLA